VIPVGCVADDYTGATDAASALSRSGLRVELRFGAPRAVTPVPDCDAAVVALRIRTVPADDAVRAAVDAARWLDPARLYHKVCSTFDSTDAGNIGPVADALRDAAGAPLALVCPAAPEHGRTVYMGHLFVGERLLSESGLRDHPLTPMRDPDLVRVLGRQTPHRVGLVTHDVIRSGPAAVAARLAELVRQGFRHAVADAVCDLDLETIAAVREPALLVGAAGLARALGAATGRATPVRPPDPPAGPAVILAGSCSPATLRQVSIAR
jgi:3-dehydrotetronate 4-kinase